MPVSRGDLCRTSICVPRCRGPGSSLIAFVRADVPMSISRSGRITMPRVPIRTVTMRAGVRARAFERPALQGLEVRRTAPRAGKARIDERRHVPALARDQRELRALRLPFGAETFLEHPVAEEGAAVGRPRLVDAAALAAHAMRTPHAGRLVEVAVTAISLQHSVQVPHSAPRPRQAARWFGDQMRQCRSPCTDQLSCSRQRRGRRRLILDDLDDLAGRRRLAMRAGSPRRHRAFPRSTSRSGRITIQRGPIITSTSRNRAASPGTPSFAQCFNVS